MKRIVIGFLVVNISTLHSIPPNLLRSLTQSLTPLTRNTSFAANKQTIFANNHLDTKPEQSSFHSSPIIQQNSDLKVLETLRCKLNVKKNDPRWLALLESFNDEDLETIRLINVRSETWRSAKDIGFMLLGLMTGISIHSWYQKK